MTLTVTQTDIDNGERCHHGYCPVALALRRQLPNAKRIEVFQHVVIVDGLRDTPCMRMQQFISFFDSGYRVDPTSFAIDLKETIPAEPRKVTKLIERFRRMYGGCPNY